MIVIFSDCQEAFYYGFFQESPYFLYSASESIFSTLQNIKKSFDNSFLLFILPSFSSLTGANQFLVWPLYFPPQADS